MKRPQHMLLINPTITANGAVRDFRLAVLNLSTALAAISTLHYLDGNIDRDFVTTAVREVGGGDIDAVGVSVMGGPQLTAGYRGLQGDTRAIA